jgi:hypothetical protein
LKFIQACDEILGYSVHVSADAQDDLYPIIFKELDGFWPHPTRDHMRDVLLGKECGKPPGFMTRTLQIPRFEDDLVINSIERIALAMSKMFRHSIAVLCNSDYHPVSPVLMLFPLAPLLP